MDNGHGIVMIELGRDIQPDEWSVIDDINAAIKSCGCSISVREIGKDRLKHLCLVINYEKAKNKNSRGAGRRKKLVTQEHWLITCGEVREMVKVNGADVTAQELGISRATLFRRLKDRADDRLF